MQKSQVLETFKTLAMSQGFYGRLLRDIEEAESAGEDLTEFYDQFKNCKDPVDVILTIEG